MSIRIKSVEIDNFTGIKNKEIIVLDKQLTIIYGKNGSGKTSILRAVEFALYGSLDEMKGSQYSNKRDEIKNKFSNLPAKVVLIMESKDGDEYLIERKKDKDKLGNLIRFEKNGNSMSQPIDESLKSWLTIDSSDFNYSVYLTQSNFHQILDLKPKDRSEAFTKLFGTEKIRFVVDEVNMFLVEVQKNVKLLGEELKKEQSNLTNINPKIDEEIKNYQSELQSLGIDNLKIYEKSLLTKSVTENILSNEPENTNKLYKLLENKQKELLNISNNISRETKIKNLNDLTDNFKILKELKLDYQKKRLELSDYVTKYGNIKTNNNKLGVLKIDLEGIDKKINESNKYVNFLKIALEDIVDQVRDECPICSKSDFNKTKIKANLTNRIHKFNSNEYETYIFRRDQIKDEITSIDNIIEKLEKLLIDSDEAKNLVINKIKYLNEIIAKDNIFYDIRINLDKLIDDDLKNINTTFDTNDIELRIQELIDKEFSDVPNDHLTTLSKIIDLMNLIQKLNKINLMVDSIDKFNDERNESEKKIKDFEVQLKKMNEKLDTAVDFIKFIVDCEMSYIEKILDTINPLIKVLFNKLQPHSYWDELQFQLIRKKTRGKITTSYNIKTCSSQNLDDDVNLRAYFSRGQANRAVLSLLIALGRINNSPFSFQMLDDVTQSLDDDGAEFLARTCIELAKDTQFIFATADKRIKEYMRKYANIHSETLININLGDWSESGIKVL